MAYAKELANMGKQLGNSLSGNIHKAIIEVEDKRVQASDIEVTEKPKNMNMPSGSRILNKFKSMVSDVSNMKIQQQLKNIATQPSDAKKRFIVKFNPAKITFQGMGGTHFISKKNFAVGKNVEEQYQTMESRIQMNVQLIFEDYERTDAFMLEKINDTTAAARTAVRGIIASKTKKEHSVKLQVEGFVSAIQNAKTRNISFHWGNMHYAGPLNHVNVEYTMFSKQGYPIRATVDLGILCVDNNIQDNDMGIWQKGYHDAFVADSTELNSKTQNMQNLFNINL